jgi:acetyl-CoA carboxylase biotin carboxyl carrier protein
MPSRTEFSHEDVLRILEIVDSVSEVEVRVEVNGLKLHVKKFSGSEVSPEPSLHVESEAEIRAEEIASETLADSVVATPLAASPIDSKVEPAVGTEIVYAPTIGCFYRSSSPNEPFYVEVGDKISPDDPVCLIEVMKVFNTIRAGFKGTVKEILASDGEMVEQEQPLFVITLDE